MIEPEKEYFNCCLAYQPNGSLIWKQRPESHFSSVAQAKTWNARYAGKSAGCYSNGYRVVSVNKKLQLAHRVIWIMHFGSIPAGMEVDHINHVKSDNRITNLRLVTHAVGNGANLLI